MPIKKTPTLIPDLCADPLSSSLLRLLPNVDTWDIPGISLVWGDGTLDAAIYQAHHLLMDARNAFPLYAGCPDALTRSLYARMYAEKTRALIPAPLHPVTAGQLCNSQHAVEFLIDHCRANDAISIICAGPLTNLAAALLIAPDIADTIAVVALTCDIEGGIISGTSIEHDLEASAIVFQRCRKVALIPRTIDGRAVFRNSLDKLLMSYVMMPQSSVREQPVTIKVYCNQGRGLAILQNTAGNTRLVQEFDTTFLEKTDIFHW